MNRAYIAGPMTGKPDFNYPEFDEAEWFLHQQGYYVDNPAKHFDGDQSRTYVEYMRAAVESLLDADVVAVLPDWEMGVGSRFEVAVAIALGLPVARLWSGSLLHPGYSPGTDAQRRNLLAKHLV